MYVKVSCKSIRTARASLTLNPTLTQGVYSLGANTMKRINCVSRCPPTPKIAQGKNSCHLLVAA